MVVGIGWSEGGHLVGGRESVSVDGVVRWGGGICTDREYVKNTRAEGDKKKADMVPLRR